MTTIVVGVEDSFRAEDAVALEAEVGGQVHDLQAALPERLDGGRRRAGVDQARGKYDEDVAQYRQQVLQEFREVEDNLSDLRLLDDQIQQENDAVNASQRSAHLSTTQYQEGQIAYLDVIDAERQVLQTQLQASQLTGVQAVATVNLIRALGGGWGDMKANDASPAVGMNANGGDEQVAKQ